MAKADYCTDPLCHTCPNAFGKLWDGEKWVYLVTSDKDVEKEFEELKGDDGVVAQLQTNAAPVNNYLTKSDLEEMWKKLKGDAYKKPSYVVSPMYFEAVVSSVVAPPKKSSFSFGPMKPMPSKKISKPKWGGFASQKEFLAYKAKQKKAIMAEQNEMKIERIRQREAERKNQPQCPSCEALGSWVRDVESDPPRVTCIICRFVGVSADFNIREQRAA